MFRLLFWATVLIMLIPVEDNPKDLSQETASVGQTMSMAHGVYLDASSFCDRNAKTCEAGKHFADLFEKKLKTGASILITYLEDENSEASIDATQTGSIKTK